MRDATPDTLWFAAQDSMLSTAVLTRLLATNLKIPVIAAGGIMDTTGIISALQNGAAAVQIGTAFVTSNESGASDAYKAAFKSSEASSKNLAQYCNYCEIVLKNET